MQHLTVSTTKDLVFRKEYICSWNSRTQFKFHEWLSKESPVYAYFDVVCSNHDEEEKQDDVTELNKSSSTYHNLFHNWSVVLTSLCIL